MALAVPYRRAMVPDDLLPPERAERAIRVLRGVRVLLDEDLAELYDVPVRTLNQQVTRNIERFPGDFMFQLTAEEAESLRSQIVILDAAGQSPFLRSQIATLETPGRGRHRKYLPRAFTEQGVAMLSSVLRGTRAVQVNIEIMRAFVRLRQMLQANTELARQLAALEKKYDAQFRVVFDAIRELMAPPAKPKERIGFRSDE